MKKLAKVRRYTQYEISDVPLVYRITAGCDDSGSRAMSGDPRSGPVAVRALALRAAAARFTVALR